ncbi:MAG: hypothetical protein GX089_10875 [Fibrobacter sp.]|nr:hypothetical protein [Fibrobacter sp.]
MWTRLIIKYGPALRVGSPTICIDKSHAKRITTGSKKMQGYQMWYEKYKNLMQPRHHEAFQVMTALSSGTASFSQLVRCKYLHNKLRIAKFLILKLFPSRARAMYR